MLRVFGVAACLIVAGCMSAPEFPRRHVSVAEVVHNARCELYDAVQENIGKYRWIENWAAAFTFTFVVDRDANATADTSYLVPIDFGSFTWGLKANLKQKARGSFTFAFKILKGLGKFAEADCSGLSAAGLGQGRLLAGEIGLRRWLNEVIPHIEGSRINNAVENEPAVDEHARKVSGEITELGYTIEFFVTADGTLTPSWALVYPSKRQFKPAFGVSLSEQDTHKLIVAMTPLPKRGPDDVSAVLRLNEKGKYEIIGRRVCVISDATSEDCADEMQGAPTKAEIDAAERQRADVKKEGDELRRGLPSDLKQLPLSTFKEIDRPTIGMQRRLERDPRLSNWARENKELATRLGDAADRLEEANANVRTVKAKQREAGARRQAAERMAVSRATSAAEAEASRRLDQLTTQQTLNALSNALSVRP